MLMKLFISLLIGMALWQIFDPNLRLSPKEVMVRKSLPMDVSYEMNNALRYLNSIRTDMGMEKLELNEQLSTAAKAHAGYIVVNNISSHFEEEGKRKYTGKKPHERAFATGYLSRQVSENFSTSQHTGKASIDSLMSAIYHRFGFLSTAINEVGVGIFEDEFDSDKNAFVYLMGNSNFDKLCMEKSFRGSGKYYKACKDEDHRMGGKEYEGVVNYAKQNNPKMIVYPYDGQRDVPPAFYAEDPDPLPSYDVSGFPISVEFNDYYIKDITFVSFTLYDREELPVKVQHMDKESDLHQRFSSEQFALFPLKRLDYNAQYTAEFVYRHKDEMHTKRWSFYTKRIQEEFHIVDKLYDELDIELKKSYVIYFPPVDAHDLLTNLQFPQGVDIVFLDHNTIKVTVMSDEIEEFIIDTGTKKLHLKVIESSIP